MFPREQKCHILRQLFEIGGLKFGQFTMSSGGSTPVYVDLRVIVSHPEILNSFAELVWEEKTEKNMACDVICGVPYTALPIATAIAIKNSFPMIIKRKETKTYGTKNMLEGKFESGEKCLVIEDVVTSGGSVLETAEVLRKHGLLVTDCVVILNREQGAEENLEKHGVTLHSLFTLNELVTEVHKQNLITDTMAVHVKSYLQSNNHIDVKTSKEMLPFSKRAEVLSNPVSKKLIAIMERKETNLCVAVDVKESAELLDIADTVGPHICMLKTHIDIIEDFNDSVITKLRKLSEQHDFLLMEDRKFGDIGNTVALQYTGGVYKIRDWADIVTVHSVPGEGVLESLKKFGSKDKACVLVAEMSSKGALTDEKYRTSSLKMAEEHKDFVLGFVSQTKFAGNNFLYMCPGVNISENGDALGQQYRSPEEVVKRDFIDVVIVGRGITQAEDIAAAAKLYRQKAFTSYKELLQ